MGILAALRAGDEAAIWAALDETIFEGSWRWGFWNLDRGEALTLVQRGGPATHAALSYHSDGRVREAAVRALGSTGDVPLRILLRRANDWVPTIARLAQERIVGALRTASDDGLVQALPLVFSLTRQSRFDHRNIVWNYRVEVGRRKGLARRLRKANGNGWPGLWAYRNLIGDDETRESVAREGLRSAPPQIQTEAARRLVAEEPAQWPLLMASRNSRIRRIGLDVAPREVLETALFDIDAGVRNDARYLYGKVYYPERYRRLLPAPGAISGLGETGTPTHAEFLIPLLDHAKTDVRRRAVEALARLLKEDAEPQLRDALRDPSHKVQRVAVDALERIAVAFDAEEVVTMGLGRGAAWRLLEKTRAWSALVAVLRHAEAFPQAETWLRRWSTQNRQVSPPHQDEATVAFVELHEKKALLSPETFAELREAIRPWLR